MTARIRDALAGVTDALQEFGAHLYRTIRTGTTCRYDPRPGSKTSVRRSASLVRGSFVLGDKPPERRSRLIRRHSE